MEKSLGNKSIPIKKTLLSLIILLALAGLLLSSAVMASGCDFITGAEKTCRSTDGENGKSFIWKISSDISDVYLLGSIHIASTDIYPLDSDIEDAFQESDKLVVEINMNEVSALKVMLLLEKYGKYPEGEGLKENLPGELYRELESRFLEVGVPISSMNDYRPWVFIIGVAGAEMGGDYSVEYGIDFYFLEKAASRGMEILELETAELQMQMLSSIQDEVIITLIDSSFREDKDTSLDYTIETLDIMVETWEEGDVAGMAEILFEDLDKEPALAPFYEASFTRRNYGMITKIEQYLADGYTYFIVVGAGHLVGDEGLLIMLEEAGYAVEQL